MPETLRLEGRDSQGNTVSYDLAVQTSALPATLDPISVTDPRDPRLGVPADANLITWRPEWTHLAQAFAAVGANDIVVLPERAAPYLLDASKGFLASGAASISDHGTIWQPSGWPQGGWFTLARARRGLLGLGPGARVAIADGFRTLAPQWPDKDATNPGRWVTFADPRTPSKELVGCAEKMIEGVTARSYFGNFTLEARNLGGVAYNMIALSAPAADSLIERVKFLNQQGFSAVPNGEAGCATTQANRTTFRRFSVDGSGSSPIMVNNCTGTLVEDVTLRDALNGMPTFWNCSGLHTFRRVRSERMRGGGLNLEQLVAGFTLLWEGGHIAVDKPAPATGYYKPHLGIGNGGATSVKVQLRGVTFDRGPWPGSLSVQIYGNHPNQRASDVTALDAAGNPLPVRFAGTVLP